MFEIAPIENLTENMKKRCQAILDNNEDWTSYYVKA